MTAKKGLGRGLGALLGEDQESESKLNGMAFLKINDIEPNLNQPRKKLNDSNLQELSESIKHHGVVQPIIVNQQDGIFRIVAGERRWRAARLAGLTEIPAIIKELTNKEVMEVALIENIQREDLNPIEEAEAFDKLVSEYKLTHEELSGIIGKSRPTISNALRLLGLSTEVKMMLVNSEITTGHARALLAINNHEIQKNAANQIIKNSLSVRETEYLVKRILTEKIDRNQKLRNNDYDYIARDLQELFGTKVKIQGYGTKKGKILIEYYSQDDLGRIFDMVKNIRIKK